jgi:tRNA(fMet)-specific endonuclease VapC
MKEPTALSTVASADDPLYLSAVTAGELAYGAYRSDRVEHNFQRLQHFLHSIVVIPFDRGTANEYGRVHGELRGKGRPIPANDMWIAAQARQFSLILVTRDAHFNYVDGLTFVSW